jgi:ribosomal protein S19
LYYNKNNFNLVKKLDKNIPYISYKSNHLITKTLGYTVLIRKGIYFRKVCILPSMVGKNLGFYVNSRKLNTRFFKKKKR